MRTVGIIGGMGPLATVDLMNKIIQLTPAKNDQDHIHMIVDNYPQIPDRTSAIMGKGDDPSPFMEQSAIRLQQAGADLIVIACNTAHYYLHALQSAVHIPILNMPKETAKSLDEAGFRRAALLATDGTLKTRLYQAAFRERGIVLLEPDTDTQAVVMKGIYAVKSGDLDRGRLLLTNASQAMADKGADAIIAGCTEIPLVLEQSNGVRVIDPTSILARTVVEMVYGKSVSLSSK